MKKILLALSTIGIVSAVSFSACGAADPCTATSKCSADVKRTEAEIKSCQTTLAAITTCKAEVDAFTSCFVSNQKCTSDNKNDAIATLAACKTQYDAQVACQSKPAADAGTKRDGG